MPVAMMAGGARYYLGYDQVGSLRVVADDTGAVVKQIAYDSFGNVLSETNATFELPFGFAGGLRDADTGLTRFGFRDYDPEIGRWTAKDPIGFAGGDNNLYGYCVGNPVNLTDPDGRILPLLAAGAVIGATVNAGIYAATTDSFTWTGLGGAALSGAITGAVGVIASPIAGAVGLGSGLAGAAAVNAVAGAGATALQAAIDPNVDVSAAGVAMGAAANAGAGWYLASKFPTRGMNVFGQVGFPRTWSGVIPRWLGGNAGINARRALEQQAFMSTALAAEANNLLGACPYLNQ